MLSTKNIKESKPKTLRPGNCLAKVYDVQLKDGYNPGSLDLLLFLEGEDQGEEFEGFFIAKDDPSMGRHAGQVARVRASQYAFEDKELKTGMISRDESILKVFMALAKAQGVFETLNAIEAETIQEYVEKARPIVCNGKFVHFCLAGKEYEKSGYTNYDLFLPRPKGNMYPFGADDSVVIRFNSTDHIIASKKAARLDEFSGGDEFDI